jgi:hypothetical protein
MFTQLKKDQLLARKNKETVKAKLLTTLISDAAMIGKNDGNREPTESEIIALIKKYIKNAEETLLHSENVDTVQELTILESYLPHQLSDDEIWDIVRDVSKELNLTEVKQMGLVMKHLKQNYDGQFDGASASRIAKEHLSS